MNTKLTLRLDEDLIKAAKKHAKSAGKSVSQLVAEYFYVLDQQSPIKEKPLTPIVSSLKGSLKHLNVDEEGYRAYLEDKYL